MDSEPEPPKNGTGKKPPGVSPVTEGYLCLSPSNNSHPEIPKVLKGLLM